MYKERFFTHAWLFPIFPSSASRTLACDAHEYIRSGAFLSNLKIPVLRLRVQALEKAGFFIRSSGRRTGSRESGQPEPAAPGFWPVVGGGQVLSRVQIGRAHV